MEIQQNGISYVLDKNTHTANIKLWNAEGDIQISKSIKHENEEYIINKITGPDNDSNSFDKIKSVVFSDDSQITIIEKNAFARFINLKKIIIPSHVKIIGEHAFYHCDGLQSVEFSNNSELQSIGLYAFGYTKIQKVTIPQHVKRIEREAFDSCSNLVTVEFTENSELEYIGIYAFYSSKIKEIMIPPHVKSIDNYAFSNCHVFESIIFSE